jgi:hypothetical protein
MIWIFVSDDGYIFVISDILVIFLNYKTKKKLNSVAERPPFWGEGSASMV